MSHLFRLLFLICATCALLLLDMIDGNTESWRPSMELPWPIVLPLLGMIDIKTETTIRLQDVGKYLPSGRNGRRLHLSTALRWILSGVKTPTGEVVKLEGLKCGSKWITSVEAVQRFCEKQTPRLGDQPTPPCSVGTRLRASERAAKQLEQLGI